MMPGFFGGSATPANFAREMIQKPLHFVQRGRILLRCGSAFALSLPSLGVSSLDLGRLFTQAALFLWAVISRDVCNFEVHFGTFFRRSPRNDALAKPLFRRRLERSEVAERNRGQRVGQCWRNPRPPARTLAPRSRRRSSM